MKYYLGSLCAVTLLCTSCTGVGSNATTTSQISSVAQPTKLTRQNLIEPSSTESNPNSEQSWVDAGDDLGQVRDHTLYATNLIIDPTTNRPYLSFFDLAATDTTPTIIKRLNGQNWEQLDGGIGRHLQLGLSFDAFGTPLVAYVDATANRGISVLTFDATNKTWQPVGTTGFTDPLNTAGDDVVLQFSYFSFSPIVAYHNSFANGMPSISGYNTTCAYWGTPEECEQTYSTGAASRNSIQLAVTRHQPLAYLAYREVNSGKLMVISNNIFHLGTDTAHIIGAIESYGAVTDINLALDQNDTPYVSFISANSGVVVLKYDGSQWQQIGTPGFAGDASLLSMALGPNGNPYVAFADGQHENKASVMAFKDGSWNYVGSAGFSNYPIEDHTRFAIDKNGLAYFMFHESTSEKMRVVKFNLSQY